MSRACTRPWRERSDIRIPSEADLTPYVGLPWNEPEFTCWSGPVCRAYRDLLGIDLPWHDTVPSLDRRAVAAAAAAGLADRWEPVAAGRERSMDLVLFRIGGFPSHCGLVVSPGLMLHVSRGTLSCVESYRGPMWAARTEGFYRLARAGGGEGGLTLTTRK